MFHRLIRLIDLHDGLVLPVTVAGKSLLLIQQEGRHYLIQRHCPHGGKALDRATLSASQLRCPGHGLSFSLESGRCVEQPELCLARYQLAYDGQWLGVEVS